MKLFNYNKTTLNTMKKITLILIALTISISSNLFASIETNRIITYPAPNGSVVLQYQLRDTVTFDLFSRPTTIIDKKGNKLIDLVSIENLSDYHHVYFDGKILVIYTTDGVSAGQIKVIAFKVSKKGLKKLNEKVFDDAKYAHSYGKLIVVTLSPGGQTDLMVFNNKLSKKLFEIPASDFNTYEAYPNGVIPQTTVIGDQRIIKYTKKGKPLSQHSIPIPAEGDILFRLDDKGGLLYWVQTGFWGALTNSPVTYIDHKGKKILDNVTLDGIPTDWYVVGWNTKYLYVVDSDETKVFIYKIGKITAKVNEINDVPFKDLILEKSKVYSLTKAAGFSIVSEYDKTMVKKKWNSPNYFHLDYAGKGVFMGKNTVANGLGRDVTLKVFKGDKIIAIHNYYQP